MFIVINSSHILVSLPFTAVYDSTFTHTLGHLTAVPFARCDRVNMEDIHGIDLLKTSVFGLNEEEVDDEEQCRTAASEDKSVEIVDGVRDEPSARS